MNIEIGILGYYRPNDIAVIMKMLYKPYEDCAKSIKCIQKPLIDASKKLYGR